MSGQAPQAIGSRQEMVELAARLIEPAARCLSPGKARLRFSDASAHYSEDVAGMEGYARVLWALVPMLKGGCPEAERYWALWREGLINGTNPAHREYWGDVPSFDQRMVEMAPMGMALCLIPERFYFELTKQQQDNLYAWMNRINDQGVHPNNWRFFRVLVNIGFMHIGRPFSQERLDEDLALIESHYIVDGWYYDLPTQRDYYTLWAFHYYGLIYAKAMETLDPERSARFIRRAKEIAPRFACWFDESGRALPYGRSLTYRFAQSSFWAALGLANAKPDGMDWGEIKHLLLQNIRYWLTQSIFDREGALTVGYGYPNLCMAEGYNAPGSPYWAFKAFAVLALPPEHPFWTSEEKAYKAPETFLDEHARLLLTRTKDGHMLTAYTAGNRAPDHMHGDEKYEKFAYSTQFAFSIVKEATTLKKGAFDSVLALREEGRGLWHARAGCESFALSGGEVAFRWSPLLGVTIDTRLIPLDGHWHIRRHTITSERALEAAEGAFAVRRDWAGERPCDRIATKTHSDERSAFAHGACGSSAIYALRGYQKGEVIVPECNTNLLAPRTVLPMLIAGIRPGVTELICAVYASEQDDAPSAPPDAWNWR